MALFEAWRKTGQDWHVLVRFFFLNFEFWPNLTWRWPFLRPNGKNEGNHRVLVRPKWPVSRDTHVIFSFWWPYLTWPCLLLSLRPLCYLLHLLVSLLAKFGFAAVFSSVCVADKVKSDDFYLCPDLDLSCDVLKIIFKISIKVLVESFRLPLRPPR